MAKRKPRPPRTIDVTIEGAQPDTCDLAVSRLRDFALTWEVRVSGPSAYRRYGAPVFATEQPVRQMAIHGRRLRLWEVGQEVIEAMRELQMPCALALNITILPPREMKARDITRAVQQA